MTRKPPAPALLRSRDALVAVGYVVRAHGLRGELRLKHLNADSKLLLGCDRLVLRKPDQPEDVRTIAVLHTRQERDTVLACLEGVGTRTEAEALVGLEICVPRGAFPEPAPDEWYIVDLVGLAARRADGTVLGEVRDVVQYPTIDCLCVQNEDGTREVPMVEPYFLAADVAGGFVTLGPLDELELEAPKRPKGKGPRPHEPTGQVPDERAPRPPAPTGDGTEQ